MLLHKDRHYPIVKVNCSDVHYHTVVEGQYILFYLFYTHINVVTITE